MRLVDADDLIGRMHVTQFKDGADRSLVYALIDTQPTIEPEPLTPEEIQTECYQIETAYQLGRAKALEDAINMVLALTVYDNREAVRERANEDPSWWIGGIYDALRAIESVPLGELKQKGEENA